MKFLLALALVAQTRAVVLSGQSLAVGCNTGSALSTTQSLGNVRLTGNTLNAGTCTALGIASPWPGIPLVEASLETPASGLANFYATATGNSIVAIINGKTATAYSGLKQGTAQWLIMEQALESFGARNVGETVLGVAVIHGESDRLSATYSDDLLEWQTTSTAKAWASTETDGEVVLYVSQMSSCTFYNTSSLDVCLAPMQQYNIAKLYPSRIKLTGAKYHLATSDGVHLTAASSRQHGAEMGRAIANDANGDWQPLQPIQVSRAGAVITLVFHVPVGSLALDTTLVSNPGNYGFTYACGDSPPAISSVALLGSDSVTVTLASEPSVTCQADDVIRYAYTGTSGAAAGPTTGMRGNLRDTSADAWEGATLYDWGLHAKEQVPD